MLHDSFRAYDWESDRLWESEMYTSVRMSQLTWREGPKSYAEHQRAPGAEAVTRAPLQSRIVTETELVGGPRICPIGAKCTLSSSQPIQV